MKKLILPLLLLFTVFSPVTFSAIDTFEFDSVEQEETFYELTHLLRCPKCQNQNISDSNAGLAKDLRKKTYELVKQGKSKDEVVDYMVARFGNFVRYDPPITPATIFLWIGPLLVILLGFLMLFRQTNKSNRPTEKLDENEEQRLQSILKQEDKS